VITPGPGYYDPQQKSKKRRSRSVRLDRRPQAADREEPGPGKYGAPVLNDKRIPVGIRPRYETANTSWTRAQLDDFPGPGAYGRASPLEKVKGGNLTHGVRRLWPSSDDHKLAYRTPHHGFIKRTYSSRYYHVNSMIT
jgi:hypothetical protein